MRQSVWLSTATDKQHRIFEPWHFSLKQIKTFTALQYKRQEDIEKYWEVHTGDRVNWKLLFTQLLTGMDVSE